MALVLYDRVKVRSTSTGTGAFALGNSIQGFQDFSVVGDGNETFYGIVDASGNWEIGRGTYTASGNTLSRDQVLESSNNDNLVNFSGGSKNVFCTFPASIVNPFVEFATGNYLGEFAGNVRGSVFADDSTLLVDGTNGTIPYSVLSNAPSIPADVSDLTDTTNLLFDGDYGSLSNTPSIPDIGSIEFSGTTITSNDSSTITFTPHVTLSSGLIVGDSIIPSSNLQIDLGSASNRFRDLYLSGSTIDLGGTTLSRDTEGNVSFNDSVTSAPKKIIVSEIEIGDGEEKIRIRKDRDSGVVKIESLASDGQVARTH